MTVAELNAIERAYEWEHADDFVASGYVEQLIAELRRLQRIVTEEWGEEALDD